MKICTITCHDVYNHGASLQAYALMHFLELNGHEVEIINYKPDYLSGAYKLLSVSNDKWKKNTITKTAYVLAKLPGRVLSLKRKYAFDKFRNKFLKITENRYSSNKELKKNPPEADIYICGSDQIWNTLHKNGKDPAFYLDFVPKAKGKIAYAASLATDKIHDNYEDFVSSHVTNIEMVSVRERSGISLLNRLGVSNITHVMDPAFLLDKEQWNSIASKKFNAQYILIYDFDSDETIKNHALKIAKEHNYKIYTVNPGKFSFADRRFDNVGPDVFISLVRDARLVISNSFHAIVFSLIFETEFIITPRKEAINTRMLDLLESVDLANRFISDSSEVRASESTPNIKKLATLIAESKKFLFSAINKTQ